MTRLFASLAAAVAASVVVCAGAARADDLHVTNMNLSNGYEFVTFEPNGGTWPSGPTTEYTGQQELTGVYSVGGMDTTKTFDVYAWCVDVFHNINLGANDITYTQGQLTTNNGNGGGGSSLTSTQVQEIAWLANEGNALLNRHHPDNTVSAAVQAAIWEVEYGATNDANNDPKLDPEIAHFLKQAAVEGPNTHPAAYALTGGGGQYVVAQGLFRPVPEPSGLAVAGAGVIGLLALRRRRAG